jgi:hypothetical protein
MRRWNGWGDATTVVELPAQGASFLHERLGAGRALPDATLEGIGAGAGLAAGGARLVQR